MSTLQISLCRPNLRNPPAQTSETRPIRLFLKPSFGDLRCKTSLHVSMDWSVFAPCLPTPGASVTSPLHTPREVLFVMHQRRVLLTRIKWCARCILQMDGEVCQGQFCKWMTTIEGSLEPLCRLTHSIIQARRCRRVTSDCLRQRTSHFFWKQRASRYLIQSCCAFLKRFAVQDRLGQHQ
jgi:hypothetical protein